MRWPSAAAAPPAFRWSWSFAAATSFTSSPYVKARPDSECTTAVLCASCFLSASKSGKRGSVEAILDEDSACVSAGLGERSRGAFGGRPCVRVQVVREKKLRAHIAEGD